MKTVLLLALALTSITAFSATLSDQPTRLEFDKYYVNAEKAGTVTVNVDVEEVKVGCHGLDNFYSKETLSTGEVLVTKTHLMHTMEMCRPAPEQVVKTGISFKLSFKRKDGGATPIIVPAGAKVILE
jgi:hypothetical protein